MILTLQRERSDSKRTFGVLFINGIFECFTLEDPVREVKIPGITAIPAGKYEITITHSPKFKRMLPLLIDVPNFEGVRIHPGNKETDTEGCILPGEGRTPDAVVRSRRAFDVIFQKLVAAFGRQERVWIVVNPAEGIM